MYFRDVSCTISTVMSWTERAYRDTLRYRVHDPSIKERLGYPSRVRKVNPCLLSVFLWRLRIADAKYATITTSLHRLMFLWALLTVKAEILISQLSSYAVWITASSKYLLTGSELDGSVFTFDLCVRLPQPWLIEMYENNVWTSCHVQLEKPPPYEDNHEQPQPTDRPILLQQQLPIDPHSRLPILLTILSQPTTNLTHPLQTITSIQ